MYKLKRNLSIEKLKDGKIILKDQKSNKIKVLNKTASYILENFNKGADDIAKSIFDSLDNKNKEIIRLDDILNDVNETINIFKKEDVLVNDSNILNKDFEKINAKFLYIEITSVCNEKCIYCYNEKEIKKVNYIKFEHIKHLINQCNKDVLEGIVLSGGEPLLHNEIDDILSYLNNEGINIAIISNGTLINKEMAKLLSKYRPSIQLTIDGFNEDINDISRGIGTFKKQIEALNNLKEVEFKGSISIRTNLWSKNTTYENISNIVKICEEFNVNKLDLMHVKNTEVFKDELKESEICKQIESILKNINTTIEILYEKNEEEYKCELDRNLEDIEFGLRISPEGDIYTCQYFLDKQFSIGNIYYDSLYEAINSDKNKKLLNLISIRRNFLEECISCVYSKFCHGGCPAKAYLNNGNILTIDGSCSKRKLEFKKHYCAY